MRHRNRIEIINQILEIANDDDDDGYCGARKTQIMHKAFLSYSRLKEYLTVLTDNDLLSCDLETGTFKTTDKGRRFLEKYNEVNNVMKQQQVTV